MCGSANAAMTAMIQNDWNKFRWLSSFLLAKISTWA